MNGGSTKSDNVILMVNGRFSRKETLPCWWYKGFTRVGENVISLGRGRVLEHANAHFVGRSFNAQDNCFSFAVHLVCRRGEREVVQRDCGARRVCGSRIHCYNHDMLSVDLNAVWCACVVMIGLIVQYQLLLVVLRVQVPGILHYVILQYKYSKYLVLQYREYVGKEKWSMRIQVRSTWYK